MSDSINELAGLQYNLGDIIRQTIASSFIIDYGIVKAVNSDKTVDVTHAVRGQYIDGTAVPLTVSTAVEVIFPGSASAAITWPISVGDGVLLVGLKQFVSSTNGIQIPSQPPSDFPHYNQETLKAIPLQNVASPAFTIAVDASGLLQIKNTSKSLFSILQELIQGIQGATYIPYPGGSAGPPVAIADTTTKLATALTDLALLLKA